MACRDLVAAAVSAEQPRFLFAVVAVLRGDDSLVLVPFSQGGVRVAYTEQLSQFGDSERVDPGAVDRWLSASGTLEFDPPHTSALQEGNGSMRGGQDRAGGEGDEDGGAAEARYDCGLDSCHKTFKHDHFLAGGGGGLPAGFGEGV